MANIIEFEDKVDLIDSPEVPDNQKLKASEINKIRDLINEAYYRVRNLEINGAVGGDTVPIGTIMNYAGDGIQNGWLICDGREVSRTEYADLFSVIGTKYGAGDGTTTFDLPQGLEPIYYDSESETDVNLTRYDPSLRIIIKAEQIVPITSEVVNDFKDASKFNAPSVELVMNSFSNPNILINANFRNPVNQRGLLTYTGTGGDKPTHSIDRWRINGAGKVAIKDGYVEFSNPSESPIYIKQMLEENTLIKGVEYTCSFYIDNLVGTVIAYASRKTSTQELHTVINGFNEYSFTHDDVEGVGFRLDAKSSLRIYWKKLEQGSIATLDVPRLFAEESALCKRYMDLIAITTSGYGDTVYNTQYTYIFKTQMRVAPTITIVSRGTEVNIKDLTIYKDKDRLIVSISHNQIGKFCLYDLYLLADAEIH